MMSNKKIYFIGLTLIIFGCCYIYQKVYPHIAGQVLITFYSDIKLIMSGQVPDGYNISPEQALQMSQFINLTYFIKIALGLLISALGAIGILQFTKRLKAT
jgi:hypothetical protein